MLIVTIFILGLVFVSVQARIGVDLSVATTLDQWSCLKSEHAVDYASVRVYRNVGQVDGNSANSIKNAYSAGITDLASYLFPCMPTSSYSVSHNITCPSVQKQIESTLDFLRKNSIFVSREIKASEGAIVLNRLWLDIEDEVPAKYYDADPTKNQAFFAEIVDILTKLNIPIGIYTSKTHWQNVMASIEGYSQYPLWYPRYDGVNSMDFFVPFSGWDTVQFKQTDGDIGWCGISQVDPDYSLDV